MQTASGTLQLELDGLERSVTVESSSCFVPRPQSRGADIRWHYGTVSATVREQLLRQRPATLWLTGLSGAGKSTIAYALERILLERGHCCFVVDGDNLRHQLNSDLGFSAADRRENVRRAAEVAHLMNEAGLIAISALISPFSVDRAMAAEIIGRQRYFEVYVNTSGAVCEQRDPKGLYARARRGEIPEFTGISSPYEAPQTPDLELDTERLSSEAAAETLYDYLIEYGFIRR